jgi:chromosome segregation ATPase
MPETITPEIITIAIASLGAFTFLLTLIILVMLSRIKKRLFILEVRSLNPEDKDVMLNSADMITSFHSRLNTTQEDITETKNQLTGHQTKINEHAATFGKVSLMIDQQAANLTQISQKITSIESCLNRLNRSITESQNQLTGYGLKLNEYDSLLGENSRMASKNAADLTQVSQRIDSLDGKYQEIKVFRSTVEKTCGIISNAFGSIQSTMLPNDTLTIERQNLHEEVRFPS